MRTGFSQKIIKSCKYEIINYYNAEKGQYRDNYKESIFFFYLVIFRLYQIRYIWLNIA